MAICFTGGMKKDRYESLKNGIKWLRQAISQRKKEVVPLAICAVLVMVTVISIVKIIQIRNAEARQAQEALALQEEFVSESGDDEPLVDETDTESDDIDSESELADDSNAWYHDIDVDIEGLKEQNSDIVGWIYFEEEDSISYPLLYSGDDYYLRRNYLKEEETAGSIYIDGNNSPDLDDAHTLIYGHNMRNLSMFGKLKFYKTEEDYFENHRYFQLITETGAYRYEIFAYKDVSTLTGGIYTTWKYVDDDFKKFVEDSICQGSYVDADIDIEDETHIVTLSTCSYDSDVRFIVSAVRIEEHEWKN
jgi:sortase B